MLALADAGLTSYPFGVVPPIGPTSVWADRRQFRAQLEELVASWRNKPTSGIYLLWADFGAGKTHALRYIEGIAASTVPPSVAVYAELPEAAADFKEVYQQIVFAISEDALTRAIFAFRQKYRDQWLAAPILKGDRDTPRAMWMLAQEGSDVQAEAARKWMRAERLYARELAQIDYLTPIRTAQQAVKTLSTICRIMLEPGDIARVVLMLDEFQRIGQVSRRRIADINSGIRTLYNSCPTGLAIVLSYSFGVRENIRFLVTPEVQTCVEREYALPALTREDANTFILDLLKASSIDGEGRNAFTSAGVKQGIDLLVKDVGTHLTPRKVMQAFTVVLDGALQDGVARFPLSSPAVAGLYRTPAPDPQA